jgi:Bacterial PH domain
MHKLFASQLENEKVFLVIRQHWIFLAGKFLYLVVLASMIPLVYFAAEKFVPQFLDSEYAVYLNLFVLMYSFVLLLAWLLIVVFYYLNINIVTDQRIVDINQVGLFGRQVSELQLENIEDTTSESHGLLATVFDYGNVYIQTAGAKERFEFQNIAHPEDVKKMVLDLYEKAVGKNSTLKKE